jgi:hypothetical protein
VPPLGDPGSSTQFAIALPPQANGVIVGTMTLNGRPVAGSIKWQGPVRSGNLMVGRDGAYRIEGVEPGTSTLTPLPDGKIPFSKCNDLLAGPWTVEVNDNEAHFDIAMTLEMGSLSGRVVDAHGIPQKGLSVRAYSDDACWRDFAYSDEQGRFDLSVRAGPWAYELAAGHFPDIAHLTNIAPDTHGLELVLPGTGTLRLRVVDRSTRSALSGFNLDLEDERGEHISMYDALDSSFAPDPQGWFEVKLQPGAWRVSVFDDINKASGYLPLDAGTILIRGGEDAVELELEQQRGIELDLQLADGQTPWPSSTAIFLLEADHVGDLKPNATQWDVGPGFRGLNVVYARKVKLDSNGRAHVISLRPGACRFVAFPDTVAIEPEEIVVSGTETAPIEILWTQH